MAWQCPNDGSANEGFRCIVCGRPRVPLAPRLIATDRVLDVPLGEGLTFGVNELTEKGTLAGVSRRHARIFFDSDMASWVIVKLSASQALAVNGVALAQGARHPLGDDDQLLLGSSVEIKVELRDVSGPTY
jgi:hypothetical protein